MSYFDELVNADDSQQAEEASEHEEEDFNHECENADNNYHDRKLEESNGI